MTRTTIITDTAPPEYRPSRPDLRKFSSLTAKHDAGWANWWLLGFNLIAVLLLQWHAPLPIEWDSLVTLAAGAALLVGIGLFYTHIRRRPVFAAMCFAILQFLLFSAIGCLFSYLVAQEGGPLQDDMLARWDAALGFDWIGYVRWVDSQPWLVPVYKLAYASLVPQIALLIIVQGFANRLPLMRQTLFAAMLCGTICIILSSLVPAVSNFVHLGLTAKDFAHVDPYAGYLHLAHFTALRDGSLTSLALPDMQGIITFPSYHAGLASVTAWSFYRTPGLRIPGVILSLLTIAATPVDGGHYLVDVIAGIIIAVFSITVTHFALREPRPAEASLPLAPALA